MFAGKRIKRNDKCLRFRQCCSTLNMGICITLLLLMNILLLWDLNYPCIIPTKDRARLVYMVKAFTEIMTELNVTHWVDYGTLLGALKYEDIIIWDYNADVSFEGTSMKLLHNGGIAQKIARERYNIFLNATVMIYEEMQTNIYSWKKHKSDGGFIYARTSNRGRIQLASQSHDFNASFIERTVLIPFVGGFVRAPYPPMEFIKKRYPLSYNTLIPFKVSCYFPWNIHYWLISNRPIHKIK
jgi:hypothetical protein